MVKKSKEYFTAQKLTKKGGTETGYLLDEAVVARHEETYKTTDHKYPNENVVRLVKWFFTKKEGRVLDYGFGPGENMIHLLKTGYSVFGVEVSKLALKITQQKLKNLPQFKDKVDLLLLRPEDKTLPYKDEYFDYILSNQTIYFLFSKEKITNLLGEFKRILKPGGQLIISMMSSFNSMCTKGKKVGPDLYEYICYDAPESMPNRLYIIRDEKHAREIFSMFNIHEVGYFDNNYCGIAGHHYVILASK